LWLNLPGLKGSEATLRAKAGGISVVPGRIFSVEEEDFGSRQAFRLAP